MLRVLLPLALLAGPALADTPSWFRTSSDNIHCLVDSAAEGVVVACEIREKASSEPLLPKPADCDLDWGSRFAVGPSGGGYMGCHGDTVQNPSALVLLYGQTGEFGPISCSSTEQGLECRNGEGHGFFLSRATQRIF